MHLERHGSVGVASVELIDCRRNVPLADESIRSHRVTDQFQAYSKFTHDLLYGPLLGIPR